MLCGLPECATARWGLVSVLMTTLVGCGPRPPTADPSATGIPEAGSATATRPDDPASQTAPTPGAWALDGAELTIVNAYDAFGERAPGLEKHFGFSAVLRYKGQTILFDSGTDAGIFAKNLETLGVRPGEIDWAVASHAHHDHIAGFDYLLEKNPGVKLYLPNDFQGLGAPIPFSVTGKEPQVAAQLPPQQCYFDCEQTGAASEIVSSGRFWRANVEYITKATEVVPGVTIVPTTSELMGTFVKYPPFTTEPRFVGMPELSLSVATAQGNVLVVGCSHSTVEEIVKQARSLDGRDIHLLVGGYHLLPYDRPYLEALSDRLHHEHHVETVAPAHCTGHLAFSIFQRAYGDQYRFFGLGSKLGV